MSEELRVVAIDDNPATLEVVARVLAPHGYVVRTAAGLAEAMALLAREPADVVITDMRMPGEDGLAVVRTVREHFPDTEIMMLTGYPSVEGAVHAMRDGAAEYLAKPFTAQELVAAVERLAQRVRRRRLMAADVPAPDGLLGASEAMRQVFALIHKAAASAATVLISGESGTGKELVARAIHYQSPRRAQAFVPVNCSAIPESLVESELFGHVQGAFTGATKSRAGFFEIAAGGTIFLDEIGDASPSLQAKLLRVLQNKEFCLVGSSRPRVADARVLAATHKDLAALVRQGVFREDLFYRIQVLEIRVPPLRERGEDVLLLTHFFCQRFAQELGRPQPRFDDAALDALLRYAWPGNVRELENLVHRLVLLVDRDTIGCGDLPAYMRAVPQRETAFVPRSLAEVEAEHIRAVLAHVGGNKSQAAEILGIDRKTLREKLRRLESGGAAA
ncbi:acetoacetate metabolism regulatory protein AtoC [Thermodesulfomicrobium sp. WS]|uniref:sigma-54-dependent transcriptional regulator n=1 Tax=Thermodesulfomicrobium sp. WS TaxID=3004129 RepID=UPI002492C382|nr:sigma-54 dependent transcriptional regulator [Thermodesulfomicrobium sp. WS]BDV00647.1 acetoacetate metabolism regulatory protein AtoC [Thermodesulfomicrobium sp. WS]